MVLFENVENMRYWENDLLFPKLLDNELKRWKVLWKNRNSQPKLDEQGGRQSHIFIRDNLLMTLGACDADSFFDVYRLLIIGCILPITIAEDKLSFSLMRRIKTFARSIMDVGRLSALAVIAMSHSEIVDIDEICSAFVRSTH